MQISKSIKLYTHIIIAIFFVNKVLASETFSKNLIIHENPKILSKVEFKNLNLQDVDLAKNKGKIMILNFWATWCAPCKKEMPSLDKLSLYFKEKIIIYPINMEKPNREKTIKFFKDLKIESLKIYFDPDFKLAKKFKMRGLPTTILIDKNGMEFGRIIGEFNFEDEKFKKILQGKI